MDEAIPREVWIDFYLNNKPGVRGRTSIAGCTRPILFCCGLGDGIARHIGEDQEIICLPLIKLANSSESLDDYIQKCKLIINIFQVKGPYWISGYCRWGYDAFEIARQLEADGREVGRLVLIECAGSGNRGCVLLARKFLRAIAYPAELRGYFARKLARWKAPGFGAGAVERACNPDFDRYLEQRLHLFRGLKQEMEDGRARYRGPVALIVGDRSKLRYFPRFGWKRSVQGKIDVIVVPGEHAFDEEILSRALRTYLDKAPSDETIGVGESINFEE